MDLCFSTGDRVLIALDGAATFRISPYGFAILGLGLAAVPDEQYVQGAIGVSDAKGPWRFEALGGITLGRISDSAGYSLAGFSESSHQTIIRPFLQADGGIGTDNVLVGASLRFSSLLNYREYDVPRSWDAKRTYQQGTVTFWEPAIFARAGSEDFQFQIQYSWTNQISGIPLEFFHWQVTGGVTFTPGF